MPHLAWMGVLIISAVVFLWIWGVVDLLKREVPRNDLYKWLGIIIIMPIVGFILYVLAGPRKSLRN